VGWPGTGWRAAGEPVPGRLPRLPGSCRAASGYRRRAPWQRATTTRHGRPRGALRSRPRQDGRPRSKTGQDGFPSSRPGPGRGARSRRQRAGTRVGLGRRRVPMRVPGGDSQARRGPRSWPRSG